MAPNFGYRGGGQQNVKKLISFFNILEQNVNETLYFVEWIESRKWRIPLPPTLEQTPGLSLLASFPLIFIIDFH